MNHPHRFLFSALVLLVAVGPSVTAAPPITAAALTPDGKLVVLGSQAGLELRTWPDLIDAGRIPTELAHVHDLRFSPDGRLLLAAGGAPAEVGAVEVLEWPRRTPVRRVAGHGDVVYRVTWSPEGRQFATAAGDGICQIFAAGDGQLVRRYEGHSRAVLAIAFLPDGKSLVSAGVDQTLRMWNSESGKHLRTLDNHTDSVTGIAVRPATAGAEPPIVVTISDDRTVRFWQPTIGRLMRFARLPSPPRAVAWSHDGARLLVGCHDGRVRVIDPDTAEVLLARDGPAGRIHELICAPGRNRCLVGGEGGVGVLAP